MNLERPDSALAGGAGMALPHAVSVGEKVAFLSRPETYPHRVDGVTVRETHMSFLFLAGPRVYKLKNFPISIFRRCRAAKPRAAPRSRSTAALPAMSISMRSP